MGTFGATPAPKEAPKRPSQRRSSPYHKRHALDRSHRITLARPPREVWSVEDGCQPLLPLWQKAGVWDRILKALQSHNDAEGELDWEVHYLDSTIVRAHQDAAGAQGGPKGASSRLLSGRLLHQGPHPIRRERQTDGLLCKRGPKKRDGGLLAPDGERGGQAGGWWPTEVAPQAHLRRQGLRQGSGKALSKPLGHKDHYSQKEQ